MKFITQLLSTLSIPAVSFAPACIVSNLNQELKWTGVSLVNFNVTSTEFSTSQSFYFEQYKWCFLGALGAGPEAEANNAAHENNFSASGSIPFSILFRTDQIDAGFSTPIKLSECANYSFSTSSADTFSKKMMSFVGKSSRGHSRHNSHDTKYRYLYNVSSPFNEIKSHRSELTNNMNSDGISCLDSFLNSESNKQLTFGSSYEVTNEDYIGQYAAHNYQVCDPAAYAKVYQFCQFNLSAFQATFKKNQESKSISIDIKWDQKTNPMDYYLFLYFVPAELDIHEHCPHFNAICHWSKNGGTEIYKHNTTEYGNHSTWGDNEWGNNNINSFSFSSTIPSFSGTAIIHNPLGE